ncbi:MAG: hypothetical protein IT428_06130 [Planctomycetaceae bacterium]|nr:hypothetical protein [Planctomycetaceae bacterium]
MKIGWLKLFERFVIGPEADPYMIRWRLIETPWFGVFFHRIFRDDADRHLHDHPWPFVSLILKGGYFEELPARFYQLPLRNNPVRVESRTWKPPLSIIRHAATDLHRITLNDGRPAWTLVFIGRRCREWGFQTEDGWIDWKTYTKAVP